MKDYSDIAAGAESHDLGFYNEVISLMEKNHMIPGYENKTFDLYKNVGKDYGYSDDLCNILNLFVEEHGEQTILL